LNHLTPYISTPQLPLQKNAALVPVQYTVATTTERETWTVKEKVIYSLLSLVGVGGTIWLGNKLIRKALSNREENKSFEDGKPATIAKQIKMAFDNDGVWGTNVTALREALTSVESQKDWLEVTKSYTKNYHSNIFRDLADELQSSEYNEMMQIINAKPLKKGQAPQANQFRAWAKRLKAAFDKEYLIFGGTDGDSIVATLNEIPTQSAFIKTGVQYKTLYGNNLLDALKSESEFGQYDEWMSIIIKKRKA
jgi:hypothetical protein